MHFVVYARDKPGALQRRLDALDAHRRHLNEAPARKGVKVLLSGPLLEDDGETMRGSFLLLDADSRAAIEALFSEDPLQDADVWEDVQISAVHVRQNNMAAS